MSSRPAAGPGARARRVPAPWTTLAPLALLALLAGSPAAAAAACRSAREVRAVLAAQVAAWNRGDLDAFMDGYLRSDSLSFYSGGSVTHGWVRTLQRYRARYQGEGREMGTLAFDLHAVEVLGRDAALVKGGWRLRMRDGEPHGLFTLVLRRTRDGWRVAHDHTSVAAP
jgi:ketosteroid isomerase-like protein